MNKYLIAAVIVILVVVGWMFYKQSLPSNEGKNSKTSYAPQPATYTQASPSPSGDEIDQEINSLDDGLNTTNDSDFDPANLSDTSVGM